MACAFGIQLFCIAKLPEGRNRFLRRSDGSGSLTLNSRVSKIFVVLRFFE